MVKQQNTSTLSPAELAEEKLTAILWQQYEKERAYYLLERFGKVPRPFVLVDYYGNYIPHGTASSYIKHMCRCADCTSAMNEHRSLYPKTETRTNREYKPRATKPRLTVEEKIALYCGTTTGYAYGHRCEACLRAQRISQRRRLGWKRPTANVTHGTEYGFKCGCRCNRCTKASREAWNRRYARRRDEARRESR